MNTFLSIGFTVAQYIQNSKFCQLILKRHKIRKLLSMCTILRIPINSVKNSSFLLIVYSQSVASLIQNKMNNQFNNSSQATVGQLFDKAVDKMMNDQKFKSSMEQKSNYNSWSSSASGSQVIHFLCRIRIKMSFLLFQGIPNKFILNQTKRR